MISRCFLVDVLVYFQLAFFCVGPFLGYILVF